MSRPKLLDLFCGAGGCSVGYERAGFDVVGVDIEPHSDYPFRVEPIRERLQAWGGPYVIENVPGAPLLNPTMFCGAALGLGATCRDGQYRQLKRHRLFESNVPIMSPGCGCNAKSKLGVYGDGGGGPSTRPSGGGGYKGYPEEMREAMGIDWMRRDDLTDAIPPAYTQFIGAQLLERIEAAA